MNAKMIVSAIAECLVVASAFGEVAVDFAAQRGEVNPRLHGSHFCPRYAASSANVEKDVAALSKLNLAAWRSHDAPLVAGGQRVVDTHFIFPLLHLDPKDPKNYFFKATDNLLAPVQEACKMKVFYRLGTSIEHTSNKNATNTLNPQDHVKYAEALAGIVRHYTRGWADGFNWDIEYWELFNEPNIKPCWRGTRDEFIDLFVTCLKRLKGEFPELKIGGPALAWLDEPFTRELLAGTVLIPKSPCARRRARRNLSRNADSLTLSLFSTNGITSPRTTGTPCAGRARPGFGPTRGLRR